MTDYYYKCLISIIPVLVIIVTILKHLTEITTLWDNLSQRRIKKIKDALVNPALSELQRESYTKCLIRLERQVIYPIKVSDIVWEKFLVCEATSKGSITVEDFVNANTYLKKTDTEVTVINAPNWYAIKYHVATACAFLLFIVGVCVPMFYISIGIGQILPNSGIQYEYNNQDFHLMFLGGFYLTAAFLVRDNARDLKSMQKIIGFGQEYPKILATQPSKIEAMLGYYQRFSNRYLSLIRK